MQSRVTGRPLPLLGGAFCLDFVNTIDPRFGPLREEFLPTFDGLVEWARYAGIANDAQAAALAVRGHRHPSAATTIHRRAIRLREALFELLRPPHHGREVGASLKVVNAEMHLAFAQLELHPAEANYSLELRAEMEPDHLIWEVTRSAVELLTTSDLQLVRECDGPDCGWLFLDTSKTHRRRWCSMEICGNRAKARRHRQRARGFPDRG